MISHSLVTAAKLTLAMVVVGVLLGIASPASAVSYDSVLASFTFDDVSVFVNGWSVDGGRTHWPLVWSSPSGSFKSPICIAVRGNDAQVLAGAPTGIEQEPFLLFDLFLRDNRGTNQPDEYLVFSRFDFAPRVPREGCEFTGFGSGFPIASGDISIHDG